MPQRDITGQNFGRLTALYPTGHTDKYRNAIWHFRCACSNEVDLSRANVIAGKTKSCGCGRKENVAPGQKFGRLTALFPTEKRDKNKNIIWRFRCDCGNEIEIPARLAVKRTTHSCGCLRRELGEKRFSEMWQAKPKV